MNLESFIAESLGQVMRGVPEDVKKYDVPEYGGVINPLSKKSDGLPMTSVDFDISITVENESTSTKSEGGNIKVIEANLTKESHEREIGESRIKFSVPISLPNTRMID